MEDVTWYVFGLMLTGIGLFLSYRAYQRKGLVAGLRGVAWSLLPLAAALTDTLQLAGEIGEDVGRWATGLVFSPVVWLGICLAGISVVLLGVSSWLSSRSGSRPEAEGSPVRRDRGSHSERTRTLGSRSGQAAATPQDDDMAEIEAILRKHGIQ